MDEAAKVARCIEMFKNLLPGEQAVMYEHIERTTAAAMLSNLTLRAEAPQLWEEIKHYVEPVTMAA